MFESPFLLLDSEGTVKEANDEATLMCGIPHAQLVAARISERLLPEHQIRLSGELEALMSNEENHGRIYATVIGLDGIGRRLVMRMVRSGESDVLVTLTRDRARTQDEGTSTTSIFDQGHLLPVARRITGIARRAGSREELLRRGLEVIAEVTSFCTAGAALEWRSSESDLRVIAEVGSFDRGCVPSILRPAVIARLIRGDVVVKEPDDNGSSHGSTLLLVPLLSHTAPVGVIALYGEGHSVLVPEEQQSLAILGEIIGLGLKGLESASATDLGQPSHRGDAEANVALGRLSAGLAHEINNAATILRSNIEQIILRRGSGFRDGAVASSVFRDSVMAIEEIRDLTDALHSFAPEETRSLEEIDLMRMLEMIVRAVRFYAKRGLGVHFDAPEGVVPQVKVRSHHLIRSLFLIFEELMEIGLDTGHQIHVELNVTTREDEDVLLALTITTAPVGLPSVLLAQLEKGGAITRHLERAGVKISHSYDDSATLSVDIRMPQAAASKRSLVPSPPIKPTRRGTILIADDEPAVIRSLRRLLEEDHDVLAAQTGREALEIVRSHQQIDIILCDISLANMNGIQLHDELKRMGHPLAEHLVFITAGALTAEVSAFLESSPNYCLEKPLDTQTLRSTIASLLS